MALEKATLTNLTTGVPSTVLFNPEEYSLNRDINYAQIAVPGLMAGESVGETYRRLIDSDAFRTACGRIAASYAW